MKSLNDEALLRRTEEAARNERAATTHLLHHLSEVQRRHLYANAGCASLFDYCVRVLRMSEPQAARRVNAARALAEFPEIEASINSGSLSLTAVSQAQSFFKREARSARPLAKEAKKEILTRLENRATRQVEKVLLAHSSGPREPITEKLRPVSETLTEMRVTIDEDTMDNLRRLQEIWSHELPNAGLADVIKKAARLLRQQLDPVLKAERGRRRTADKEKPAPATATGKNPGQPFLTTPAPTPATATGKYLGHPSLTTPAPESIEPRLQSDSTGNRPSAISLLSAEGIHGRHHGSNRVDCKNRNAGTRRNRYIPATIRHAVWQRDQGRCTYVNPVSGRRCESRHFVQMDHVQPFAKGGRHTVENLRLRCFAHNRLHAMHSFGPVFAPFRTPNRG